MTSKYILVRVGKIGHNPCQTRSRPRLIVPRRLGTYSGLRFSTQTKQFVRSTHPIRRLIVRVGRIELPSVAWEATILPLNHTRKIYFHLPKEI